MNGRPPAAELLAIPQALLTRGDLAALGLTRSMVDSVFRQLPVVNFDGTRRPAVRVADYLQLVEASTFGKGSIR